MSGFKGEISFIGHSLGSIILFDILSGQVSPDTEGLSDDARSGPAGTGQPSVTYPTLDIQPSALFALGSPIAMFLSVRGVDTLGPHFSLPTCPAIFNIFHPFDPIAFRIEPLLLPFLGSHPPVTIPHHKGENIEPDISHFTKNVFSGIRSMFALTSAKENLEANKEDIPEQRGDEDRIEAKLNRGRRVDYALQGTPAEGTNQYLFAMSSHMTYWKSKDTILHIVKQVYGDMSR